MRREILILLAISLAWGAVDQSYVQNVFRDGSSVIQKTSELTIFSTQLGKDAFERMDAFCESGQDVNCSVDVAEKTITITEKFETGGYYSYSTEYGFPLITYSMVVGKIPNDRFASALSKVLVEANVTDPSQAGGSVDPIDFSDEQNNKEVARILRDIDANLTYVVVFPMPISEAYAGGVKGDIRGDSASFDLVTLLEESKPVTIRGSELNLGYIVLIIGLLVLAGLAFSFFYSKPRKSGKKKG